MADLLATYGRAVSGFGRRLAAVRSDQWQASTPCTEWTVRDLVGHVLDEQLWVPPLVGGETIAEVGDRFSGDQLGEVPAAAWEQAATSALEAMRAPDALERTVHLSFGDTTAEEYGWQVAADTIVHTWDLARAIGADERLEPDDVATIEPMMTAQIDDLRGGGFIGAERPASPDADPQTRLLAMLGRQA